MIDDLRLSAIFGPTVPANWYNVTVTFARQPHVDDGFGGIKTVGPPADYLTTMARIDIEQNNGDRATLPGPSTPRGLVIFMPVPDDPANYPVKGDRIKWTDVVGHAFDLPVKAVIWPDNLMTHIEIEAEEII